MVAVDILEVPFRTSKREPKSGWPPFLKRLCLRQNPTRQHLLLLANYQCHSPSLYVRELLISHSVDWYDHPDFVKPPLGTVARILAL